MESAFSRRPWLLARRGFCRSEVLEHAQDPRIIGQESSWVPMRFAAFDALWAGPSARASAVLGRVVGDA